LYILLLFNLLAEFQRADGLPAYRQAATLRHKCLLVEPSSGARRRSVLQSWSGLHETPLSNLELGNSNFAEVGFRDATLA